MSNNIIHNADYSLVTVTGKVGNLGFKQTSGNTNTLASRGAKLIKTPLQYNKKYNAVVNILIRFKDEEGIAFLENWKPNKQY
jgi:hypothetical protein